MTTPAATPQRRVGDDPLRTRPRRAQVGILGTAALGAVVLAVAILRTGVFATARQFALFAVLSGLATLAAAVDSVEWRVRGRQVVGTVCDVSDVFVVAAIFTMPTSLALLVSLPSFAATAAQRKVRPYKQLYNAGQYALGSGAGVLVFHWLLTRTGASATHPASVAWLAAAVSGGLAFIGVNVVSCTLGRAWMRDIRTPWRAVFDYYPIHLEASLAATALLVAVLWLTSPVLAVLAVHAVLVLQKSVYLQDLQAASRTDSKTGLANSGYFEQIAAEQIARASRAARPLSLLVLDLDHLRRLNNDYGHLAGDTVLRGVAKLLREAVREDDVVCRFGGEEFVVLLPDTPLADAVAAAERVRTQLESTRFAVDTSTAPVTVTISIGASELGSHGDDLVELLHAADLAVYRAKAGGRNQVQVARAGDLLEVAPTLHAR